MLRDDLGGRGRRLPEGRRQRTEAAGRRELRAGGLSGHERRHGGIRIHEVAGSVRRRPADAGRQAGHRVRPPGQLLGRAADVELPGRTGVHDGAHQDRIVRGRAHARRRRGVGQLASRAEQPRAEARLIGHHGGAAAGGVRRDDGGGGADVAGLPGIARDVVHDQEAPVRLFDARGVSRGAGSRAEVARRRCRATGRRLAARAGPRPRVAGLVRGAGRLGLPDWTTTGVDHAEPGRAVVASGGARDASRRRAAARVEGTARAAGVGGCPAAPPAPPAAAPPRPETPPVEAPLEPPLPEPPEPPDHLPPSPPRPPAAPPPRPPAPVGSPALSPHPGPLAASPTAQTAKST